MKTEFNYSDARFAQYALYAAVIVTVALLLLSLLASEKAAAQPLPRAGLHRDTVQKMQPIVVTARRIATPAR